MVKALNNLVHIIEHGAAVLTTTIIGGCQVSIASIDNEFADNSKPSAALVDFVASLSNSAWGYRRSLAPAAPSCTRAPTTSPGCSTL